MVAVSRSARRLRLSALAAVALAVSALGVTFSAPAALAADDDQVALTVAQSGATILQPGAALNLTVEIDNASSGMLASGTLDVRLDRTPIASSADLDAWLADSTDTTSGDIISTVSSPQVAAGSTANSLVTVAATAIGLDAETSGVHKVSAVLNTASGPVAVAHGVIVWAQSGLSVAAPTQVALVAPITVPGQSVGLISAAQLEEWTTPEGLLSRQLDAVFARPVTIAIDPMIIASIRVLGSSAPASAATWLDRLSQAPNDIFPLAYADSDLALQSQSGFPTVTSAPSFVDALNAGNFPADAQEGGSQTATPAPTNDTATDVPTTEALLEWNYTRTDIAWPPAGVTQADDLGFFAASALTTTLLTESDLDATPVAPHVTVDGFSGIVADAGLSSALIAATDASTLVQKDAATSALIAQVALANAQGITTLTGFFERAAPDAAANVANSLSALQATPWFAPASLATIEATLAEARTLRVQQEPEERVSVAQQRLTGQLAVADVATVVTDPTLVTAPQERATLALTSVEWLTDPTAWRAAVRDGSAATEAILSAVTVLPSSNVLVVASQTEVPVTIQNNLSYPVTVNIDVDPSNGRLIVEDQIETVVEPNSRKTAYIPVTARIGNGDVTLKVVLVSPTGVTVGDTVYIEANVQADWEGLGALILAGILALVFALGLWRNIRRRRRSAAADEPAQND